MIVNFPKTPLKIDTRYLSDVLTQIKSAFQQVNSRRYAQDRLFLRSPNGKTWSVTVNDSGTLSAAEYNGSAID